MRSPPKCTRSNGAAGARPSTTSYWLVRFASFNEPIPRRLAPGSAISQANPFQPFIEGLIHGLAHQLAGIAAERIQVRPEQLEVARATRAQLVDRQQAR